MATLPYDTAWLTRNGYDPALAGRDDRDPVWLAAVAERRAARKAAPQRPATPAPATVARAKPADLSCVHRGAEIAQRACGTCSGRTMIKVMQCGLFGECTIARKVDGVDVVCATCADRKPPPTSVSDAASRPDSARP